MSRQSSLLWLKFASVLVVLTGMMSLMASHHSTDFVWRHLFNLLSFYRVNTQFDAVSQILNAVLGGIMMGWGVMMYFLACNHVMNKQVRLAMIYGLITWYCFDSLGSYIASFSMNIVLNTLFLLIFIFPLSNLKKYDDIS